MNEINVNANSEVLPNTQRVAIYTPTQIQVGSFFFGPLAALLYLLYNYSSIDQLTSPKTGMGVFLVLVVVYLLAAIALPTPALMLISAVFAQFMRLIAEHHMLKKADIAVSKTYMFESNLAVIGFGVLGMLGTLLISLYTSVLIQQFLPAE